MLRNRKLVGQLVCIFAPVKFHQLSRVSSNLRFFTTSENDQSSNNPPDNRCGITKTVQECESENKTLQSQPHESRCDDPARKQYGLRSKGNLMSECPQPECPLEEEKNYTRQLIGGIVFTAIGLFALYHYLGKDKGKKPKGGQQKTKKCVVRYPKDSSEIPACVPYLLIGGGTASFSAFRSIKSSDPTAKVLVISNESYYPYMRPPLSKEMWFSDDDKASEKLVFKQWNGTERSLFYEPNDFYVDCKELMSQCNGGVAVARGWNVTKLDACEKIAYLEDGYAIKFNKCLIATGASPKNLSLFESADDKIQERVSVFRDVYDFQHLDDIIKCGAKNIAIVGGGFLGSELACALARRGKKKSLKVHQIFCENGNMGKVLPEYLSLWTTNKVRNEGVNVISNAQVKDVKLERKQVALLLSNGEKVKADHVIVAVGVEPNTQLAISSGLEVHREYGGFLVNAELMARSDIWVAGDCTCFYDVKLGRRRVEHHDHAVVTGRLAGENMTGAGKPYCHQSMFWSDLGPEVGYEAIGIVDSALPTVGVFAKASDSDTPQAVVSATGEGDRSATEENAPAVSPARGSPSPPKDGEDYGKGVIFYLQNDVVVGIVLWNVFNRMSVARQVLKDQRKYDDLNEVAKLFNIHED